MGNPLSEALFKVLRGRNLEPYTGPTYGVEKVVPGTKFYRDPRLGTTQTIAEVPAGVNAVVVGPRDMTLDEAMHEMTHLHQGQGWLANPTIAIQNLITRLKGQDPSYQSPREEQAYRVQAGVRQQMRDKQGADEKRKRDQDWETVRQYLVGRKK